MVRRIGRCRADHDLAAMGHGVTGIGHQVENGQLKLVDVGHHRFGVRRKASFKQHRRSEGTAQQAGNAVHQRGDLH
ncbi:hypothetical protein D3C73_911590 [compost metagenome]